jgi:parallel beta-helix repeat protein
MPTIDQMDAATAVANTDELPVSQNGVVRKATQAQIVAGLQPTLAVPQANLLGRSSAGTGAPETVALGPGLSLAGGVLSLLPPSHTFADLPQAGPPGGGDLVPFCQNGQDMELPYAQFMAGLSGLAGVDGSGLVALPSGTAASRRLADLFADSVAVESFGAHGDGVTDDTAAFTVAVASGRPVRLGHATYVVNGQWTISQPGTVLLGTPGLSVLRRASQTGGAWIAIQADGFRAEGVVFDAKSAAVTLESWGVQVGTQCLASDFHRCAFLNASGPTLGCGLVFLASDPAMCKHVVRDCEFAGNAAHGVWVQACDGVLVAECRAHDNAGYGINVDYNDPTFKQQAHLVQVVGNRCWKNDRGIGIGNFNATNTTPPVWGHANPDVLTVLVSGNICHDNASYGVAVSGWGLVVQDNLLSNNGLALPSGAGLLANADHSRISGNTVTGTSTYGIDAGGSVTCDVSGNTVTQAATGVNCGGSTNLRVGGNVIQDCTSWSVVVENVESDANGLTFGIACQGLALTGNWIGMPSNSAGGIVLRNGPQGVHVARNCFVGGVVTNCLSARTDSVIVEGNLWNFAPRMVCNPSAAGGLQQLVIPDIADSVMVTASPGGVQSILTYSQASVAGTIGFIRVTAGGQGYTAASVAVGGSGLGAAAQAVVANGAVIGVVLTNAGSGYGAMGTQVPVAITGDGTGATAFGYAGLPVPEERQLLIRCNCSVLFTYSGSWPAQVSASAADLTVPANASVIWTGTWNTWRSDH